MKYPFIWFRVQSFREHRDNTMRVKREGMINLHQNFDEILCIIPILN